MMNVNVGSVLFFRNRRVVILSETSLVEIGPHFCRVGGPSFRTAPTLCAKPGASSISESHLTGRYPASRLRPSLRDPGPRKQSIFANPQFGAIRPFGSIEKESLLMSKQLFQSPSQVTPPAKLLGTPTATPP